MKEYTAAVVREGLGFGEGPRWHDGRLWYSDFYRHGIYSMARDGSDEVLEHEVVDPAVGIGVAARRRPALRLDDRPEGPALHGSTVSTFADISEYCDVLGERHGRVAQWLQLRRQLRLRPRRPPGRTGRRRFIAEPPPSTNLVVLDPNGAIVQVVPDMAFPNGTVITPDGATLIVGETLGSTLTRLRRHRRRHPRLIDGCGRRSSHGRQRRDVPRRRRSDLVRQRV